MNGLRILIKGIVQGVGFRPFVYGLARELGIRGSVTNTSQGVVVEAEGERVREFLRLLGERRPPLARIDSIETEEIPPAGAQDFIIIESRDQGSFTLISPDISVCDDCLGELFDPADRRHLYPFINCTNCGPRYSITRSVPYDRPNTTMSVFPMCPDCLAEYYDPSDRRFHAQPNACHVCGPQVRLSLRDGRAWDGAEGIRRAIGLIRDGAILAVKGIGGFHLCCDGLSSDAVMRLRESKRRSNKPFALMSPDRETIQEFCEVSEREDALLADRRRPIVLLRRRFGCPVSEGVAPVNRDLGFMLPYAPLHYLLFHHPLGDGLAGSPHFKALVMTSGNLADEPIVVDNDEAMRTLSFADAFLTHNRDIFMRVDDSVMKVYRIGPRPDADALPLFLRRARGYAPDPIDLGNEGPDLLGTGADVKNAFTLTRGRYAVMSQHIGDMENMETLRFFEESLENLKSVYRASPAAIAHDLHPSYMSTRWAMDTGRKLGIPCHGIQHHYAHIGAVMAEHRLRDRIIGVALDGTGYGTDGKLWGGELLICDIRGFVRAGHIPYVPLPGGEMAIKEGWRIAVSCLAESLRKRGRQMDEIWDVLEKIGFVERYGRERLSAILQIREKREFSPLSSGMGRLFDALSALAGVCDRSSFEGEAAMALEGVLPEGAAWPGPAYPFRIEDGDPFLLDTSEMILGIADDRAAGKSRAGIALRFHNTIIAMIAEGVGRIGKREGIGDVALSGGVFQNAYLLGGLIPLLESMGFRVFTHRQVPCNDGCISLGQAYLIRERLREG